MTAVMRRLLVVAVVLAVLGSPGLISPAQEEQEELDEVVTQDERVFRGRITEGIPETITIDSSGVIITIQRSHISRILPGEVDEIVTTEDKTYTGKITTEMPEIIKMATEEGTIEIKYADVKSIKLTQVIAPEEQLSPPSPPTGKELPSPKSKLSLGACASLLLQVSSFTFYKGAVEFKPMERLSLRGEVAYGLQQTAIGSVSLLGADGAILIYLLTGVVQFYLGAALGWYSLTLESQSLPIITYGVFIGNRLSIEPRAALFAELGYTDKLGFILSGGMAISAQTGG